MNSFRHAQSSARKWGGQPADYLKIHEFIDSSKMVIGDSRHRALYHHTLGVWLCQQIFGTNLKIDGKVEGHSVLVPVREVAERHIIEDLGWLPSPQDYLNGRDGETPWGIRPWMSGSLRTTVPLSHILNGGTLADVTKKENPTDD